MKWKYWETEQKHINLVCKEAISLITAASIEEESDEEDVSLVGFADAMSNEGDNEEDVCLVSAVQAEPAKGVPGFAHGGDTWSKCKGPRKPGPKPATMFRYSGLPPNGDLNQYQREQLYSCMESVKSTFGISDGGKRVAEEWNNRHRLADCFNPGAGIGGEITKHHVVNFLKREGANRASERIGVKPTPVMSTWHGHGFGPFHMHGLPPPLMPLLKYSYQASPPPSATHVKEEPLPVGYSDISKVGKWSHREYKRILKHYGLPIRGKTADQQERLRKKLESLANNAKNKKRRIVHK